MPYKYLPEISMADIAFKAWGSSMEEMFESAAAATTNVMVKELKTIKHKKKINIKVEAGTVEKLLFNFIDDILFYKDAKQLLFSKYKIKIKEDKGVFTLKAEFSGEKLNMKKHELIVDVKAVTMHHFEVVHKNGRWAATVVLDI